MSLIPIENSSFPFEVFEPQIAESFKELAAQYSIPPDYLGTTALFTISALSGNMYQTELNGSIKNIIYAMLIGPSGLGKSPAYNLLCGDIVEPLERQQFAMFQQAKQEWEDKREECKAAKPPVAFKDPKPKRKIRTANGGTMEGIMHHAMHSLAGFGLYYDEGGRMLGTPNAYKKETSSVDFWNEVWNGKSFNDIRADSDRERFISNTSISVLVGMQSDRVKNYFTADTVASGLTFRFLLTASDYIDLNDNVDHFQQEQRRPCLRWYNLVQTLFNKGCNDFFSDSKPYIIPFTDEARDGYNVLSSRLIRESNLHRMKKKAGDVSALMIAYDSKLYAYVGRFMMNLAIMDNPHTPLITIDHVHKSELLYRYYRFQAEKLFIGLNEEQVTDLTENERMLLDELPDDTQFDRQEVTRCCEALKLSDKFFDTTFRRKYKVGGWIKRVSKGVYVKE